jgi:hypothetical protein
MVLRVIYYGTDTVNLALTKPKIVQTGSPVARTNATSGDSRIYRLSDNGMWILPAKTKLQVLQVNMDTSHIALC